MKFKESGHMRQKKQKQQTMYWKSEKVSTVLQRLLSKSFLKSIIAIRMLCLLVLIRNK